MPALFVIGAIAIVTLAAIAEGWALSILWGWFVVPIFNAPALSIPVAIGLALTIGMMTKNIQPSQEGKKALEMVINGLTRPFILLVVGWITLQFV